MLHLSPEQTVLHLAPKQNVLCFINHNALLLKYTQTVSVDNLQFVDDFLHVIGRDFSGDDVNHLLSDQLDL